jgi:pimeloyl-ACP methyl ester carboxylesterase
MRIVDLGSGVPVVVVPGIQGRWEWIRPGVEALAARCRVITFSLADEPAARGAFDAGGGFASYVQQVVEALDDRGVDRAVVCGISYGGLIAAAVAARHPARTLGLVLVSALPPSWRPDRRARFYLRAPRLLLPLFVLASLRLYREFVAASGGVLRAAPVAVRHALNVLAHPFSPARMARRVQLIPEGLERELAPLRAPTLVVTGEPGLDRVVPVELTLRYLWSWPHAECVGIARTGHLAPITRPDEFARIVCEFVSRAAARGQRGAGVPGGAEDPPRPLQGLRRPAGDPGREEPPQPLRGLPGGAEDAPPPRPHLAPPHPAPWSPVD